MHKFILSIILCLLSLPSCNMAVDNFDGSTASFTDLPKEVQDSIIYWTENDIVTVFTDSYDTTQLAIFDKPELICFDEKYKLENDKVGPWIKNRVLTRISDGKEYKLMRNAPTPILVRNDSIIIPNDYNILDVFDSTLTFKVYKLR